MTPLAVTWVGHASALIELDGATVLTDPVLRDRIGPLQRIGARVRMAMPAHIDAVILSHLHADHADVASLRMLEPVLIIAPRGARRWLARRGLRNVEELGAGEQTRVAGVTVRATPAAHDARRWRFGAYAQPIGAIVEGSQACYFAGDTDLRPDMSALAGRVDVALLPVWGWGSSVGPGHLDPARAATAAKVIAPRVAIPIHWGTFALAWKARRDLDYARPARQFRELVAQTAPGVEVRVLEPGQRTELAARGAREASP